MDVRTVCVNTKDAPKGEKKSTVASKAVIEPAKAAVQAVQTPEMEELGTYSDSQNVSNVLKHCKDRSITFERSYQIWELLVQSKAQIASFHLTSGS